MTKEWTFNGEEMLSPAFSIYAKEVLFKSSSEKYIFKNFFKISVIIYILWLEQIRRFACFDFVKNTHGGVPF